MNVVQVHSDPFSPVLFSSPALAVTVEQDQLLQKVLDIACSDSRFAQKAYAAIKLILTAGISQNLPTVSSISPSSVKVGDPGFTLLVNGTKFAPTSVIVVGGVVVPTTFVSETQLSTPVDTSQFTTPRIVPIAVQNSNGVLSASQNFTVNPTTPLSQFAAPSARAVTPQSEEEGEHKEKELHHKKEK